MIASDNRQVLLECVEIHFNNNWRELSKVSIKPKGYNKRTWGDSSSSRSEDISDYIDPRKAETFIAFLMAVVGAARVGMKVGNEILSGQPAVSLANLKPEEKKWSKLLLVFQDSDSNKPIFALPGSFKSSGRTTSYQNPITYNLRSPFTVDVYIDNKLTVDYASAASVLDRMYYDTKKIWPDHAKSTNFVIRDESTSEGSKISTKCQTPYQLAISEAANLLESEDEAYTVRHDGNEEELRIEWLRDVSSYGDACWSFDVLKERWEAFPLGSQGVFVNGVSIGGFGFWPLTKSFAMELRSGKSGEDQITPGMLREAQETPIEYWYLSGIEIQPTYRRAKALKMLLAVGLRNICNQVELRFPCTVLACSYSPEGRQLLIRFGFSCGNSISVSRPWHLYQLKILSRGHAEEILKRRGL